MGMIVPGDARARTRDVNAEQNDGDVMGKRKEGGRPLYSESVAGRSRLRQRGGPCANHTGNVFARCRVGRRRLFSCPRSQTFPAPPLAERCPSMTRRLTYALLLSASAGRDQQSAVRLAPDLTGLIPCQPHLRYPCCRSAGPRTVWGRSSTHVALASARLRLTQSGVAAP